jgi:hypothetical protein
VRYEPEDHGSFAVMGDWDLRSAGANGGTGSLEADSAGDIAAAVQATGETGQRKSAAELLASGQRMTAALREFSPSGKTVGDKDPSMPDPTIRST